MSRPFPEVVTSPEWLREVERWVGEQAGRAGRVVTGPIEQRRVRPWSTQLTVPTDSGLLWFKTNCPAMRFEAALHAAVSELAPDIVHPPLAVDAERGWMVTTDHGVTLADDHRPTADNWCELVASAARMQRVVVTHEDVMVATGVPDCRPHTVSNRFDYVLEYLSALPDDHPSHLDAATRRTVSRRRPELIDAVDTLAASPLPDTIVHGDLHAWNVFSDGTIFDFGDALWAPAVEVLHAPRYLVRGEDQESWWPRVLIAYCDVWSDVIARRDMDALIAASALTHSVNRVVTWIESIRDARPGDLEAWGDAPLRVLTGALIDI